VAPARSDRREIQINCWGLTTRPGKSGGELLYFAQPVGTDGKIASTQAQEIQASSFDQAAERAFGKGVIQDPSRGPLVGTISQIDAEGRRKFRQYFRP
jgi:hypothetical protein